MLHKMYQFVSDNRITSAVSALLGVIGFSAYSAVVSPAADATKEGIEAYCEAHPENDSCISVEEDGDPRRNR